MTDYCKLIISMLSDNDISIEEFSVLWTLERLGNNPFAVLTSIVLSQNTSDKNTIRALKNLIDRGVLSPEKLLMLSQKDLSDLIRVVGQQSKRTRTLIALSHFFVSNPNFVDEVCKNIETARSTLLNIWGIGEKTVDVFLLAFCKTNNVFPVDRHIMRITSRLLGMKLSYKEASKYWIECSSKNGINDLIRLHIYLINFGRRICKPSKPLCEKCPFSYHCVYNKSNAR